MLSLNRPVRATSTSIMFFNKVIKDDRVSKRFNMTEMRLSTCPAGQTSQMARANDICGMSGRVGRMNE